MQQLSVSLSNVTALKKFDLSLNQEIKSLPRDIFRKLESLKKLKMQHCMRSKKELLFSLGSLRSLYVGHCLLTRLPSSVRKLTKVP